MQLRKHGFSKIILAGMSANLCTESHMRDLMESGFEVSVVKDATASAILTGINGYEAALVNLRIIASDVFTTEDVVEELAVPIPGLVSYQQIDIIVSVSPGHSRSARELQVYTAYSFIATI